MKPPEFLVDWFRRMPYHQIAELSVWMDAQPDLSKSIEEVIGASLDTSYETLETLIDYDPTDNGNQGS